VRSKVESWDDYQDWAEEETEAQHAEEEASKVRLSQPHCLSWHLLCRYGYLQLRFFCGARVNDDALAVRSCQPFRSCSRRSRRR